MSVSQSGPSVAKEASEQILVDMLCTHCGALCDDIQLHVRGPAIVAAERACEAGRKWFFEQSAAQAELAAQPPARIKGQPATVDAAMAAAVKLLRDARAPLVYGLTSATCAAQRRAVSIADYLGAVIDTPTSGGGPIGLGFQGIGEVIATLGEIANRSVLVIYWGCDPATSEPRHFERYSLDKRGMFVPRGRADRTCVVVDHQPTATAAAAQGQFIELPAGADFAALWTLRALVQAADPRSQAPNKSTGDRSLAPESVKRANRTGDWPCGSNWPIGCEPLVSAPIFYDAGLLTAPGGHWNGEALLGLVHDLNSQARFVARSLRESGNRAGADSVLTWQTGYPYAVNLAAGYPRFNPDDYNALAVLDRGEADAALIVVSDPLVELPSSAAERLAALPRVVIDSRLTRTAANAAVSFTTSTYGIHQSGLVYRADDIPLPLRAALPSPLPSAEVILESLERSLRDTSSP